ncbi:30S ribosomal protein S8 [Candidatus Omnitrophota bacterium]
MSRTDLISDVFTIIRNAVRIKRQVVNVPASTVVKSIAGILKDEGYIEEFKLIEDKKQGILRIYLKYTNDRPAIINLKRISKPGLRIYVKSDKIPFVIRGKGIALLSTSQGILSDKQAREKKTGGEVIGYVW